MYSNKIIVILISIFALSNSNSTTVANNIVQKVDFKITPIKNPSSTYFQYPVDEFKQHNQRNFEQLLEEIKNLKAVIASKNEEEEQIQISDNRILMQKDDAYSTVLTQNKEKLREMQNEISNLHVKMNGLNGINLNLQNENYNSYEPLSNEVTPDLAKRWQHLSPVQLKEISRPIAYEVPSYENTNESQLKNFIKPIERPFINEKKPQINRKLITHTKKIDMEPVLSVITDTLENRSITHYLLLILAKLPFILLKLAFKFIIISLTSHGLQSLGIISVPAIIILVINGLMMYLVYYMYSGTYVYEDMIEDNSAKSFIGSLKDRLEL